MTAAMAASLAEFPDFNGADLARRLLDECTPTRGYGKGTREAIERLRAGTPWREAGAAHAGRVSFGNGAATRAAPIGLVFWNDADSLRWVAEEQSLVTHAHSLACEGAVLQAYAVALALATGGRGVDRSGFLLELGAQTELREYRSRLETAARLVARGTTQERLVARLGNGRTALGSVVTAATCFALYPDDFRDAVCFALSLGGNANAIAAMTGAIAGAHLGVDAIPAAWREQLATCPLAPATAEQLARRLTAVAA